MSHLSAVGHPVADKDEFRKLAYMAFKRGRSLNSDAGSFVAWSPSPGVQLWVEVNRDKAIVGCNPHFSGLGKIRVGVAQHFTDYGAEHEGRVYGWVEPLPNCVDIGLYPIVVDIIGWSLIKDSLPVGSVVELQVAAFAHELFCYNDDHAFDSSQGQVAAWSAESFLLMGMLEEDGTPSNPPRPEAIFAGHIERAELRTNKATNKQFHYLIVRTVGGVYDVVADPAIVKGVPVIGGVVQGSFWLSGRRVDDQIIATPKNSLLSRIFRRKPA